MSKTPKTPDRVPGLQYPSHLIESNQTDAALKNAFDNLFYLRKQLDTLMNAGTLTRAQVEEIITSVIKNKTFNVIAEPIIVGTHATRLITAPVLGAAFYETDTSELFIGSDASGTLMWASLSSSGTGDVTGPAVSVDGDVAVFSGITGKIIKDLASPGDATKFLNGASPPAYAKVKDSDLSTSNITTNNVTSTKHGFAPISPADATKFLNGAATPAYAQVLDSDLSTSDITTNNVTSAKHGFAPKSAADATKFLNSAATPAYAQVKDSDLSLSNITTNNVSAAKHGFAPILPGIGGVYLDGNGNYTSPAGSGSGNMFGFTPTAPNNASYSWVNQGGATVNTTLGIYLEAPAAAANNVRIRKLNAAATPYTITIAFVLNFVSSTSQAGLIFRESGSGKFVFWSVFQTTTTTNLRLYKMTNPTTLSTNPIDQAIVAGNDLFFLRISDDGVNRLCDYSSDSVNWINMFTEGRTVFITADEVGFAVNAGNASFPAGMTLLSWA